MKAGTWGKTALATASALALSCALAPAAFAANPEGTTVGDEGDFGVDKKATTEVAMDVNTDQIAASVPVKLKVVAKTNGGDLLVPTEGYKIVNKSPMAIHVDKMQAGSVATGWTLVSNKHAAAGTAPAGADNELFLSVKGTALSTTEAALTGAAWNVAAKNDGATDELALTLEGTTSQLNSHENVTSALTISYTIAPGSNS